MRTAGFDRMALSTAGLKEIGTFYSITRSERHFLREMSSGKPDGKGKSKARRQVKSGASGCTNFSVPNHVPLPV